MSIKIDAVIPWVDGNDPVLKAKRMKYVSPEDASCNEIAAPTRFASLNEITYCVCSILRNIPFINCIYIITDAQTPPLEDALKRNFPDNKIPVRIVDHSVIFRGYEDALPTFNSGAIETVMWRIPGLSEYFLYFNDDWAVTAPLSMEDVFRDGRPVVNGYWRSTLSARLAKGFMGGRKVRFRNGMLNSALLLKAPRFVKVLHVPRLYHRTVQEKFYAEHPDVFERNLRYRFRCAERLDNNSLVATVMARDEGAVLNYNKNDILYLEPRKSDKLFDEDFERCKRLKNAKYFCANSLDEFPPERAAEVQAWLAKRLDIIV